MSSNSSDQVWLVIDSQTFGGIETHVLELAKGLKLFNIHVQVWLLRRYPNHNQLKQQLEQANVSVDYLDRDKQHCVFQLRDLIQTQRPTVVHAHGYKASIICKLLHLITGVAQITTYHAGETPKGKVWFYDLMDRYSCFLSTHSLAVSHAIMAKLPSRSVCFNNFIDNHQLSISTGQQIAFVGRLSEEKAPDRFIEIARLNHELNFDVYGSGPMETAITDCAPINVRFHGHQSDMSSIWPNVGLLVICSRFEGLPMAALEAMARGIPVLALNVGNLNKLIRHQHNGFLVNSMEELNQQLQDFVSLDSHQRSTLQRNAVATVEQHFSPSAIIPQMLELYFTKQFQTDSQIEK